MSSIQYDIIFITNIPSFYKIRQWNEISKIKKILVLFTGETAGERNKDFFSGELNFNYLWLQSPLVCQLVSLLSILLKNKYKKIIIGGWDGLVISSAAFISPKKKNGCIIESSVYESTTKGVKGFLKKLFMKRISVVYASGKAQDELARAIGFKRKVIYTGGCGILNYVVQPSYIERKEVCSFLYVGRFSEVKNLELLICAFNNFPHLNLSIIGFGPLEETLKSKANSNIHFLGAIKNADLIHYYRQADVFILPSKSEPWGLVVEEALNNGTPVIVSDKVGCRDDLVTVETGLIFKWNDIISLQETILKMTNIDFYNKLRKGISSLDFQQRSKRQIESFCFNDE